MFQISWNIAFGGMFPYFLYFLKYDFCSNYQISLYFYRNFGKYRKLIRRKLTSPAIPALLCAPLWCPTPLLGHSDACVCITQNQDDLLFTCFYLVLLLLFFFDSWEFPIVSKYFLRMNLLIASCSIMCLWHNFSSWSLTVEHSGC